MAISRRNRSANRVLQSASGQMTGVGLILGTGLSTISDRAKFSFAQVHVPVILVVSAAIVAVRASLWLVWGWGTAEGVVRDRLC